MKYNIEDFEQDSFLDLKKGLHQHSIFTAIDLALLSKKNWLFYINYNEYKELSSAYGLILDNPKILLVPDPESSTGVDGFLSIYDKLDEKLSLSIDKNLNNIKILVVVKDTITCEYKKVVSKVTINDKSNYSQVLDSLKKVGYEQTNYVEQPKQFCIKGGVIDIYSPIYNQPTRVCLYDTETSLSFYNLATGLSSNEKIEDLILTKRSIKKTKVTISSLFDFNRYNKYIFKPELKEIKGGLFTKIDYKVFIKNKTRSIYLEDVFFSAYQYKGFVIAPASYKKGSVVSAQQEDVALERGDFVCHEDFGVGVLIGLIGGDDKDEEEFLKIKYEDAVVQLSIRNLHKLSFVSRENISDTPLNSLSKKNVWARQKSKVTAVVEHKIKELVDFYTNKKNNYRAPYNFGGQIEKSFLDAFEYEDTPDQEIVWKEIAKDLEGNNPMYRLLCGDVGFGKTELSIRAAFRVVINNGQVLILAPTTVLAGQHFKVFKERLESFGVIISLFVGTLNNDDKNKIKTDWVEGKIDILIGTSAVVYNPVFIKYTSLFVVDEEHKFGVKDKEGVLEGFVNKDVLLMSATPIPRSLNLSLSGLNDISTLGSPPVLRKPIQTFINYFNDSLIKRSIEYEVSRGGQVFFVHNNISSMLSIKNYLLRILPRLRILVAHSKVAPSLLQKNILSFVEGSADLLLCTSIIGSGIDIPNANTIIINSSHRFGLGQLHQIRGRVGRSDKQGYAYMLIPETTQLNPRARKRLITIEKNVSLGSGYHIAKSDLQIRGGGMLFGYNQSGKSFDFGFEFYSKLMSKSLSKSNSKSPSFVVDNFVYNVPFLCVFPNNYIENSFDRLRNYRLLNSTYSTDKLTVFCNNLIDLYGPLPVEALNLTNMRLFSLLSGYFGLFSLVCKGSRVVFSFNNSFKRGKELFKFLDNNKPSLGLVVYKFNSISLGTELLLDFNVGVKINGAFLVRFLKLFKDSYEEI